MEFKDKRVIVTGGTKGLGKAIAIAFAQAGAWVAVNYHADSESAETTESELKQITGKVIISKTDVASKEDVDRFIKSVMDQWEHVDILVNNAGIIRDKFLMFLGEEIAWRGYLVPRLLTLFGPKKSFLIGGSIWALFCNTCMSGVRVFLFLPWHMEPLIGQHPPLGCLYYPMNSTIHSYMVRQE